MMTSNIDMPAAANNDAELVQGTLAGNRDAFATIVSRYQSLICSLAYSATGSLGQSEDLAQETFITAWKHLGHLRERHKLRAWLCGIARNRINNFLRREGREPIREAEPLEDAAESHVAPEPHPAEQTITNEEQAILWRALERIPQLYREPLVLFYREHQSIDTVAQNLDLTEDTVKQRLSRGRKLLQEQVLSFIEGALEKTNPGKAFTANVLAALPAASFTAKTVTMGAAVAKGGLTAKTMGVSGILGAVCTPFLVVLGNYASYRMSMDEAQTDHERFHIKTLFRNALLLTVFACAVLAIPLYLASENHGGFSWFIQMLVVSLIVLYFPALGLMAFTTIGGRRRYLRGELQERFGGQFPPAAYEYCSRASLFGVPLLHVRIGDRFDVIRPPIVAWIAIGSSHSIGLIFASGGLAIAPISFGGIAVGLVSFGAISMGLLVMGAFALGAWATGGITVGWQGAGGIAAAWNAALGGIAIAHDFAGGNLAHAVQANTDGARQFFQDNWFFQFAQKASSHPILTMLIWIIPMGIQSRIIRRARERRLREESVQA